MNELKDYSMICEFCAKETKFIDSKQVTLKIDKTNVYQNLFANICPNCEEKGLKKTIHGQTIKTITNKNKFRNEESIFDEPEGE